MKPSRWIVALLVAIAATLPVSAAPKTAVPDSRIQVEFVNAMRPAAGRDGTASSSSELRNLSFMREASLNRQDPLRREKNLLDDCLRRELRGKS